MSFQNCKIVCEGASPVEYHRQIVARGDREFVMSSSSLREFAHCQSRWKAGYESPESKAKKYGSLFDCLLLTPAQFAKRYAVQPDEYETTGMECPVCHTVTDSQFCRACKTTRRPVTVKKPWTNQSETCQAWIEAQTKAGLQVVAKEEVENAQVAVKRLLADEILSGWHASCATQVWVAGEWADEKTGLIIPCRCLIDYVPRLDSEFMNCAGDLKTTRSGALRPFERWCRQQGYHIQAAFNLDMLAAAEGKARSQWCLILSENFAPWEPGRRLLSEVFVNDARKWVHHQLGRYAHALATGKWRGYDDHPAAVQGWSVIDQDARAAMYEQEQAAQEEAYDAQDDTPETEDEPPETDGELVP